MRNGRCGPCVWKFVSNCERQCRATKRRGSATSIVSVGARGLRSRQAWCGRRWTGDASQLNLDLRFPSHVHTSQHFTARPRHVPRGLHRASHAFADMSVDPVFWVLSVFPMPWMFTHVALGSGHHIRNRAFSIHRDFWSPALSRIRLPLSRPSFLHHTRTQAETVRGPSRVRSRRRGLRTLAIDVAARHLKRFQFLSGGVGIGRKERSELHVPSLPCSFEGVSVIAQLLTALLKCCLCWN